MHSEHSDQTPSNICRHAVTASCVDRLAGQTRPLMVPTTRNLDIYYLMNEVVLSSGIIKSNLTIEILIILDNFTPQ